MRALVLRQLEASGVLRLDSRVAAVWPQFSAAGKGGVTVAEVLGRRVEGRQRRQDAQGVGVRDLGEAQDAAARVAHGVVMAVSGEPVPGLQAH